MKKIICILTIIAILLGFSFTNSGYVSTQFNLVNTDQTPSINKPLKGYDDLKNTLKDEIVPQAVTAILETYDDTFGYLTGSNIGIGLELTNDESTSTLALVKEKVGYRKSFFKTYYSITYTLSVNLAKLDTVDDILTEAGSRDLEQTICHEMMHALMFETHTCGMNGRDTDFNETDRFPLWFIEGTAQTTGGALDWLKSLALNEYSSKFEIKSKLIVNKLSSNSAAAQ